LFYPCFSSCQASWSVDAGAAGKHWLQVLPYQQLHPWPETVAGVGEQLLRSLVAQGDRYWYRCHGQPELVQKSHADLEEEGCRRNLLASQICLGQEQQSTQPNPHYSAEANTSVLRTKYHFIAKTIKQMTLCDKGLGIQVRKTWTHILGPTSIHKTNITHMPSQASSKGTLVRTRSINIFQDSEKQDWSKQST
jgi:hypothetical protein